MEITMLMATKTMDFLAGLKNKEISLDLGYKLTKIKAALSSDINFYTERLKSYVDLYAEKDSNGVYIKEDSGIKLKKEKINEFNEKINELNNMIIKIPDELKIPLSSLQSLEISFEEIEAFFPFISEE